MSLIKHFLSIIIASNLLKILFLHLCYFSYWPSFVRNDADPSQFFIVTTKFSFLKHNFDKVTPLPSDVYRVPTVSQVKSKIYFVTAPPSPNHLDDVPFSFRLAVASCQTVLLIWLYPYAFLPTVCPHNSSFFYNAPLTSLKIFPFFVCYHEAFHISLKKISPHALNF